MLTLMTVSYILLRPVHTGDKDEFNTVDFVEYRVLLTPAKSLQQSRLLPLTLLLIRSTLLLVLATSRQELEFNSLSRSTLLPIRSTLSTVCMGPMQHG